VAWRTTNKIKKYAFTYKRRGLSGKTHWYIKRIKAKNITNATKKARKIIRKSDKLGSVWRQKNYIHR
jgi:hypothetical protein